MDSIDERLRKLSRVLKPFSEGQNAEAAVVLLLKADGQALNVLLVKRVENPRDFWSGQVALPGGRRESRDENLKDTVIREAFEETGIDLHSGCRFLGVLEASNSAGRAVMVLPFVVFLEHDVQISLERRELEGFNWVRLDNLANHRGTARFSFGEVPAFFVDDYVVWGLTYRVLDDFLHALESV